MLVRVSPRPGRVDVLIAAEAVLCSVLVHLGVRCAGVRTLVSVLDRMPRTGPRHSAEQIARIARIGAGVSRRLSVRPTCLKSGLVVYALLRRRRVDAALVIGARRPATPGELPDTARPFEAHAWIEHEGRVLCGAGGGEAFSELWRISCAQLPETTP